MGGRDWTSTALALLRIVAAVLFIEHGTAKLIGFPASEMPQPAIGSLLWIGGLLEAFGGLLVLLGLFTRPVAFLLAGEMAVAYWMFHAPQGPFPMNNGGDASILFCFVFLLIAAAGPGRFAIDGNRTRRIDTARID